jgi:hypothetical protein
MTAGETIPGLYSGIRLFRRPARLPLAYDLGRHIVGSGRGVAGAGGGLPALVAWPIAAGGPPRRRLGPQVCR